MAVIDHPEKTELKQKDPCVFEIIVSVMPELKIGDCQNLKISHQPVETKESEVEDYLNELRKTLAEFKEVQQPAQKGNRLEISLTATDEKNMPVAKLTTQNHPLILGETKILKTLETNLIGMLPKEKKSFQSKLDHLPQDSTLTNQVFNFEVTLNKVEEMILPEVSPEFIQKVTGQSFSLEQFQTEIKNLLLNQKKEQELRRREIELIDALLKITEGEIPLVLVEQELQEMQARLAHELEHQGMQLETYLTQQNLSWEALKRKWQPQAEREVKIGLIFEELLKKEPALPTETEIQAQIKLLSTGTHKKQPDFKKDSPAYLKLIRQMRLQKIVNTLLEK
ncbi:trigger factor [Candidatus Peregrinibacteria bacterium CG1_02_41_10]|nr:MAG: trigger factor [Candidatus Peregrinibacteria bacterium CG1_02_41_10]